MLHTLCKGLKKLQRPPLHIKFHDNQSLSVILMSITEVSTQKSITWFQRKKSVLSKAPPVSPPPLPNKIITCWETRRQMNQFQTQYTLITFLYIGL
jgi:hypothetical protein